MKTWMPERLEGERLYLRPAAVEDAEETVRLVAVYADVVRHFQFFERMPTVEDQRAYYLRKAKEHDTALFAIAAKDSGALLGTIGLHEIDWYSRKARFGYILFDKRAHGRGFMREAAETLFAWAFSERGLNLNKIWGVVHTENVAGLKTDLSLGFRVRGYLPEDYWHNGVYHDQYYIALLRREWDALRSQP